MTNKQNPENPSTKHQTSFEILKAENLSCQYIKFEYDSFLELLLNFAITMCCITFLALSFTGCVNDFWAPEYIWIITLALCYIFKNLRDSVDYHYLYDLKNKQFLLHKKIGPLTKQVRLLMDPSQIFTLLINGRLSHLSGSHHIYWHYIPSIVSKTGIIYKFQSRARHSNRDTLISEMQYISDQMQIPLLIAPEETEWVFAQNTPQSLKTNFRAISHKQSKKKLMQEYYILFGAIFSLVAILAAILSIYKKYIS